MKKPLAILIILSLAILATTLQAQITARRLVRPIERAQQGNTNAAQPGGDQVPGQTMPTYTNYAPAGALLIKTLDTNHNGVIEAAEINNAPEALKKLDLNGDGKLTEDEYLGKDEQRPSLSPILEVLDMNKDGVIDAKEIASAPASLRMLDKNFDGKISPSEYRPQPASVVKAKQ